MLSDSPNAKSAIRQITRSFELGAGTDINMMTARRGVLFFEEVEARKTWASGRANIFNGIAFFEKRDEYISRRGAMNMEEAGCGPPIRSAPQNVTVAVVRVHDISGQCGNGHQTAQRSSRRAAHGDLQNPPPALLSGVRTARLSELGPRWKMIEC
jgi:hypothetical protein